MTNFNDELRAFSKKERLKKVLFICSLVLLFLLLGYLTMSPVGKSRYVTGIVTGIRGGGHGVRYLVVKLDRGNEVLVSVQYTGHFYKKGRRISLQKRTSNILGGYIYSFQHYIPEVSDSDLEK